MRSERCKFRFSFNGRILTITRIGKDDEDEGWDPGFYLRAYLSTEVIPDFMSTVYTYWGLEYEEAPPDTTKVKFHLSATVIPDKAFIGCQSLVRVTIPDTVTWIEDQPSMVVFPWDSYDCRSIWNSLGIRLSITANRYKQPSFRQPSHTLMMKPSVAVNPWDSASCHIRLIISVIMSSMDVIDYPPQLSTACPEYATALPSILSQFKNVLTHTELNAPWRLTINKWRHFIFYAPILMVLVIVSVPICNWLQRLPNSKTRTEWLLFSIFVGRSLLS